MHNMEGMVGLFMCFISWTLQWISVEFLIWEAMGP